MKRPLLWLVPVALLCALPFLGKPPVIDEESYLWLGDTLSVLRPYDWVRIWQPWSSDSFIYAHPPGFLWIMAALRGTLPWLWTERLVMLLTFGGLYAWAVGLWARRSAKHPSLAAGLWLTCATTQLGLHNSLMVDLPMVALGTAGLALYRDSLEDGDRPWRAGVAFGLALCVKYTAALLILPVVVHLAVSLARKRLGPNHAVAVLGPALLIFAACEGFIAVQYGRFHLWEVWTHRGEIEAGPAAERALGVLVRMALLPLPLVLLIARPALVVGGVVFALLTLAVVRPAGVDGPGLGLLLVFGALGATSLARALMAVSSGTARHRKGDRGDALLLGGTVLSVAFGVLLTHNYASARYLLPASAPLAILLVRSAEEVAGGKTVARVSMFFSLTLGIIAAVADYRFAEAGVELAVDSHAATEKLAPPARRFAGEWSFRWAMEQRGWQRYQPDEVLPPGTIIAVAEHASPGAFPKNDWEAINRLESVDRFTFRVMLPGHQIGLYSETLGALPLGIASSPLEATTLYRVR